jgi:hypothetical protein
MCDCELCKFGRKLQELVDKYKMSEKDKDFLLNDVFLKAEYLEYEIAGKKRRKDARPEN